MLRKSWNHHDAELSDMLDDAVDKTGLTMEDVASRTLEKVAREIMLNPTKTVTRALELALDDVMFAFSGDVARRSNLLARRALFECGETWPWLNGSEGMAVAQAAADRLKPPAKGP